MILAVIEGDGTRSDFSVPDELGSP